MDFLCSNVAYVGVGLGTLYWVYGRGKKKGVIKADKKQGGYGKIPVFKPKTTLRRVLSDPKGFVAIVKFKSGCGLPGVVDGKLPVPPDFKADSPAVAGKIDGDIVFCGDMLDKVSRSFGAVIRQLPATLALPVCIFYLVLRALDTVEDDMDLNKFKAALAAARATEGSAPPDLSEVDDEEARVFKEKCLVYFHTLLQDTDTANDGTDAGFYNAATIFKTLSDANVGEKDEATLFQQFDSVVRVYSCCAPAQRVIIADITRQMALGMAEYINRDLSDKGTETLDDYGTYCHYVAGLVGEGLSRLWATASDSGLAPSVVKRLSNERGQHTLSSDMGLFLQKNNIIRDYLEDILDKRAFWPREVWGQYVERLGDLKEPKFLPEGIACLNHMICDALEKIPFSLEYLRLLEGGSVQVLRFCAIPQVMAVATLVELYANPLVFQGVVKIGKITAVRIVVETGTMQGICGWFLKSVKAIRKKLNSWKADATLYRPEKSGAVVARTEELLAKIEQLCC